MKGLLFILAFMLIGNFAFASDNVKDDVKNISTFDVEKALTNSLELIQCTFVIGKNLSPITKEAKNDDNVAFPCKVRECVTINGKKYCTEWEDAECVLIAVFY